MSATKPQVKSVEFSDGKDSEKYLIRVIAEAKDLSSGSSELESKIINWPSEYHLSRVRHNLLKPLKLGKDQDVLEIGSGCGAITRFLGENVRTVDAIEGNRERANICAARTRDLSNVKVSSGNFEEFAIEKRYDLVTLIGVLEYVQLYSNSAHPIEECLQRCLNALKSDGSLLIAIENKLGLKYLVGHPEDHLGKPGFGIQGLYSRNTPITFGKKELTELLHNAGFGVVQFLFPFPDYKMPSVVITETAFQHSNFHCQDLLSRIPSRSYGTAENAAFCDDTMIWSALFNNGIMPDLANSFLVVASKSADSKFIPAGLLAQTFPHHGRGDINSTTQFLFKNGRIVVEKATTTSQSQGGGEFSVQGGVDDYCSGTLYFDELKRVLAQGGGVEEVATWASDWIEYLRSNRDRDGLLPEDFIDCVPYNFVRANDGKLVYFDREWCARNRISFFWVYARGLIYSIHKCASKSGISGQCYKDLLFEISKKLKITFPENELGLAIQQERRFTEYVVGASIDNLFFEALLDQMVVNEGARGSETHLNREAEELNKLRSDFESMRSSRSWKLTAPLRGIRGIFSRSST